MKDVTDSVKTPYDIRLGGPISMEIERKIVNGNYKNHLVDHFNDWVMEEQINFYDIGANIGLFSLMASKSADDTSQIYSFEPAPMNISKLWHNIRINEAKNIDIQCFALGATEKRVRINIPASNFAESTLASATWSGSEDMRSLTVQQTTVDNFFDGENDPNIIKVEAEGAEVYILRGAIDTLTTFQPDIYLVIHPPLLEDIGADAGEIGSILDQCGYTRVYDLYAEKVIKTDVLSNIGPDSHAIYLHVSR